MEIENKFIKFKSEAINIPLNQNIDSNTDYIMRGKFSSNGGSFKTNGNGKNDIYYTLTPSAEIEFLDTKKQIVFKGQKQASSVSKKIRARIYLFHNDEGIDEEFEAYYEKLGAKIVLYMPEIIEFLKTKN